MSMSADKNKHQRPDKLKADYSDKDILKWGTQAFNLLVVCEAAHLAQAAANQPYTGPVVNGAPTPQELRDAEDILNQANKDESKVVKAQLHEALQIMSGKPAAPKATQKESFLDNVRKAATRFYGTTTGSDNTLSTATTLEDTAAAALRAKTFMALLTTLYEHKALADGGGRGTSCPSPS